MALVEMRNWLDAKARSFERKRNYRDAISYWERLLIQLTRTSYSRTVDVSDLAAIHYRLGLAHRAMRDPMKSIHHLKYSIRLNSSEPRYYEAFGKAFLSGGHWKVAKSQFERAIRLDPQNPTYLRQYAWVLLMMGKKELARSYAEKAFVLKPRDREGRWHLIRVYMECGLYFHAARLLKRFKVKESEVERRLQLLQECREREDSTFEGLVIHFLRRGMRVDGRPFDLLDFRRAEFLWETFCLSSHRDSKENFSQPHIWAAAVAAIVFSERKREKYFDMTYVFDQFSAGSVDVWPLMKRIQENKHIQKGRRSS